jgi:hypothetical protein
MADAIDTTTTECEAVSSPKLFKKNPQPTHDCVRFPWLRLFHARTDTATEHLVTVFFRILNIGFLLHFSSIRSLHSSLLWIQTVSFI